MVVLIVLLAAPQVPGAAAPGPPPPAGSLQPTPDQPGPGQPVPVGPTVIEAEEIVYDAATNTVTARGRVRVTHPLFRLFAPALTYDLQAQVITAEGRVRLIDAQDRELRGEGLVYSIPQGEATVTRAETIVDRVYVRAQRVRGTTQHLTGDQATVTTCDPARPLYRITARRVEIVPGELLVAHHASLWLGSVRIVTLGRYEMSLVGPEREPRLPRVGQNPTDGFWIDYRYPYEVGDVAGEAYLKYGQRSGIFGLNTLRYDWPAWRLALDVGRAQREDPDGVAHALTTAELSAAAQPWRIGGRLALSGRVAAGWFDERDSGVSTTRLDATLTLATQSLPLGPNLAASASVGYRFSLYGTGQQRGIISGALSLTYRVNEVTTVTGSYTLATVRGGTPFLFDVVNPSSTVALGVAHVRPDFRIQGGISHDFVGPETKLSGGVGFRVSPSFFFDVAAVYNVTTRASEDVDYTLTYQCDCLTVALRYRQIRQEWWLTVRLGPSDRLRFLLPAP